MSKPRKFKAGDKVTEKENTMGYHLNVLSGSMSRESRPLKFGEVYTVRSVDPPLGTLYPITLEEFPATWGFDEDDLEKVVSDSVLEAELETIKMPELV